MWSKNIFILVGLICLQGWVRSDSDTSVRAHAPHQKGESRIVGGETAELDEANYAVFLKFYGRDPREYWTCTGSLISRNYVLTARHCLLNALYGEVYLGAHDINYITRYQVVLDVNVMDHFLVHDRLKPDIALIKLPNYKIPRGARIRRVRLPRRREVLQDYNGTIARAYGWGQFSDYDEHISNVLRYVDVSVLKRCNSCNMNETCTSGIGGKGTCHGDSGGPLVIPDKVNGDLLIGVTSWGYKKCESGHRSFYVLVNRFLDWISDNSNIFIPY